MEKQFIQVQVAEGVSRLEIFEGEALEQVAPKRVEIFGKIDSPANWWKVRKDKIDKDHCHVIVTDDSIELHMNELSVYEHGLVKGTLKLDHECSAWGINNESILYDSKVLARMIKASEYLFPDRTEWQVAYNSLMRFESNVQVNLKDIKETSGDIDKALKVTVNNNIASGFKLRTRIFGMEREEYVVDIGSEFVGHNVKFYLDSSDLALRISEQREELIANNTKVFIDDGIAVIYT